MTADLLEALPTVIDNVEDVSGGLMMWTIYERPRDFPEWFVVRRWCVGPGGVLYVERLVTAALTLEDARRTVPRDRHNLGRHPSDDPAIREVWI